MNRPVTILQSAEESGVSTATVSRVINGTAPVSQATRDRVNAVIQRERGEGVSVISCDQLFSTDYFVPRLTSAGQHNELFGRLIINALLGLMSGEPKEAVLTYGLDLVVRESCAPPCAAM